MASKSSRGKRRKYTTEFKAEAARLVLEDGLTRAQVSRDLGVPESVVCRWVQNAQAAAAPGALSEAERAELKRRRAGDVGLTASS